MSLTSGFSIRRNPNNVDNTYTLTVLTRPLEDFDRARKPNSRGRSSSRQRQSDRYYHDSISSNSNEASVEPASAEPASTEPASAEPVAAKQASAEPASAEPVSVELEFVELASVEPASVEPVDETENKYEISSEISNPKNYYGPDNSEDDYDIPVYVRPTSRTIPVKSRYRSTTLPSTTSTKYYIKTRPTPFSANNQEVVDSTENSINTEALVETGLQNSHVSQLSAAPLNNIPNEEPKEEREYDRSKYTWSEPSISPFKTLDNLRNTYRNVDTHDHTTSTTSTTVATTTTRRSSRHRNIKKQKQSRKPSYYSYRVEDEVIPDQTTEIFNGKGKTVIKAFLNNFVSSSAPKFSEEFSTTTTTTSTTPKPTTTTHIYEDEVVNIGYQKKPLRYVDEKPLRSNVKRLQIITEPPVSRYVAPSVESIDFSEAESDIKDFSSTTTTMVSMSSTPFTYSNLPTSPMPIQSSTSDYKTIPSRDSYQSKFSSLITSTPENEGSYKFQNIINDVPATDSNIRDVDINDGVVKSTQSIVEDRATTVTDERRHKVESEIASTTSTTKSTTTMKFDPTTSTTKSISFPPRASRVNPAIKLAATNPGGGRRSYQSSSKCSSDNSLQANPKCNEIKYQRYKTRRLVV